MDINLFANTTTLPAEMAAKISHAYTTSQHQAENLTKTNSIIIKTLSTIEKLFKKSLLSKFNQNHKAFISTIINTTEFISKNISHNIDNKPINIQANLSTPTNTFFKKFIWYAIFKNNYYALNKAFDDEASMAYLESNKIVIGSNFTTKKNGPTFSSLIHEKHNLNTATEVILLHEIMHTMQDKNNERYGNSINLNLWHFIDTCQAIIDTKSFEKIMEKLSNTIHKNKIFKEIVDTFYFLPREIYADTGAFLIKRNMMLSEKQPPEKIDELLDTIISSRKKEHLIMQTKNIGTPIHLSQSYDHFSAPALEFLKEKIKKNPNTQLNLSEIHKLCNECVVNGLSKVIVTLSKTSEKAKKTIEILEKITHIEERETFKINLEKEPSLINIATLMAGYDWNIKGQENLNMINENIPQTSEFNIWNAFLNHDFFEQEIKPEIYKQHKHKFDKF